MSAFCELRMSKQCTDGAFAPMPKVGLKTAFPGGVETGNARFFNRLQLSLRKQTSVFEFKSSAWPLSMTKAGNRMRPPVPPR
jgi:hypothetical protein